MFKKSEYQVRNATITDLDLLVELEKKWPIESRATEYELKIRIEKFAAGYFIAEDSTGIIGSIIAHPYYYDPNDLSNFASWATLVNKCYSPDEILPEPNALYIISGTSNKPNYEANFFNTGVNLITELAKKLGLSYVIGGALLPGYSYFLDKNSKISAEDYVFEKNKRRSVDPLIEKYRRIGFHVPHKNHVLANYFPDKQSLNYSALVVKTLESTKA